MVTLIYFIYPPKPTHFIDCVENNNDENEERVFGREDEAQLSRLNDFIIVLVFSSEHLVPNLSIRIISLSNLGVD